MEIIWPVSAKVDKQTQEVFGRFVQMMANRIAVGQLRYGLPKPGHQWMKRAQLEKSQYRKTGNAEHLINLANYAFLEVKAPEHARHHHDPTAKSATRGRKGIKDTK